MSIESKFKVSRSAETLVRSFLEARFEKDVEHGTRYNHSLYFDTVAADFAMAKASSDYHKDKIRLRFYSQSSSLEQNGSGKYYLEHKAKKGSRRAKQRGLISLEHEHVIQAKRKDVLVETIREELSDIAPGMVVTNLKPLLFISYKRERFITPFSDSRIALDTQITAHAHPSYTDVLMRKYRFEDSVLEIKGEDRSLPTWMRPLSRYGVRSDAYSKYFKGYCAITGYRQ